MKLWSFQPQSAITTLQETGLLKTTWEIVQNSDNSDLMEAYQWLTNEMELRGIKMQNHAPIWAWNEYPQKVKFDWDGESSHLIEFEAPDNLVCLTDFDNWHHVLNKQYCPTPEEDKLFESLDFTEFCHLLSKLESPKGAIETSWQRIFENINEAQATLPYIKLDWVIRLIPREPHWGQFRLKEIS